MRSRQAYSLIELSVVLAILTLLLAFSVPSMFGMLRGNALTQQSEVVLAQLKQARQRAVAENRTVEVRFYSYESDVGNDSATTSAFQVFQREDNGIMEPVRPVQFLQAPVVVSGNPDLTKIGPEIAPAEMPPESLPETYTYRAFQFRPDGTTSLELSEKWYLTLLLDPEPGELPANFATVQIEPFTGAVQIFRP
jgi:uncharacterized protein (TIGR02596 family)